MKKWIQILTAALLTMAIFFIKISEGDAQNISLSLKDAVSIASSNNPEIKSSRKEIEKTDEQKIIARSMFLPTVGTSASVNHFFQLSPFFGFGESTPQNKVPYGRFGGQDQLSTAVTAVQPLYNPAAFPATQQARLAGQQSKISAAAMENSIIASVKQTYLQLLVLTERINLQHESIQRNQRALQDARILLIQGKGLRVDTLRAYTAARNLEPELLKLTYAAETGKLRLKALLGLDSLSDISVSDSLSLPDPAGKPDEATIYETALQANPGLQLFNIQRDITQQQIKQANALKLPIVSLAGQYQVQSQVRHFDYGAGYYPTSSYAGLQVSLPLFTGFSNHAKSRQAAISHEQSELQFKNAHAQIRARVHEAVAGSKESLVRLKTTASVKETAKLSYTIVQYRYEKGISSRLELTDAELALSTAQSNYLEAVYDYLIADVIVDEIMGKNQ